MSDIAIARRSTPEPVLAGRLSSDERLAQLASRGSSRAFAVLYERHHRVLYGYCRSIVRNDEDAQDALQSAVERALAALRASDRDIAVRPWLFRIVHNEAISLLRRRRPEDRPIDEGEPAHVDVAHTVESRERLALLVADIQTLGERQRAALLMRELSGLSMEEIAAALATSPAAAKQALFEARCALHELAEGRAMECDVVRRTLSERDGRVLRGRKLRAHLRACAGCVQFRAGIEARGADLRALAPPVPAMGLLAHVLELGSGPAGTAFGGPATASLVAKGLTGAVIVTAAATSGSGVTRHVGEPVAPPARESQVAPARQSRAGAPVVPPETSSGRPLAISPRPRTKAVRTTTRHLPRGPVTDARSLAPPAPQREPAASRPAPERTTAESSAPATPSVRDAPPGHAKQTGPPGRSSRAKTKPSHGAKPAHEPTQGPKPDRGPKATPPGNPHAESQAPGATPGPPSGTPGHGQDAHGNAPQPRDHAGPRGLASVVRVSLSRLLG